MWSNSHHFFHQCKHDSYLIRHVVYTLYFKLYSNSPSLSLTYCHTYSLSLFLSHTHAYTGLISVFFFFFSLCLSLSPGLLTNKTTASGTKSAGHPRDVPRTHSRPPLPRASLHRKQASGCYRSSPCLLSKV